MYAGVIVGTLVYAGIHMGIPLTLYDVCILMGPSMISVESNLPKLISASVRGTKHDARIIKGPRSKKSVCWDKG